MGQWGGTSFGASWEIWVQRLNPLTSQVTWTPDFLICKYENDIKLVYRVALLWHYWYLGIDNCPGQRSMFGSIHGLYTCSDNQNYVPAGWGGGGSQEQSHHWLRPTGLKDCWISELPLYLSNNEPEQYPWGCRFYSWPHSAGEGSGTAVSCGVGHRHGIATAVV